MTGFGAALPAEPSPKADPNLPVVTVSPRHHFGQPCVGWTSTSVLAGAVDAGDDPAGVAEDYGTTRAAVLTACWYEGLYGCRESRRAFRTWARKVEGDLWAAKTLADYDTIPDPPVRGNVGPEA